MLLCHLPKDLLNNSTLAAQQCSGDLAPDAVCIALCPNTDLAGIGVRLAFYMQSFFNSESNDPLHVGPTCRVAKRSVISSAGDIFATRFSTNSMGKHPADSCAHHCGHCPEDPESSDDDIASRYLGPEVRKRVSIQ